MKDNNKFDLEIQSFDIKEYVNKILSYWKVFTVCIIVALIVAKGVNMFSERIYSLNKETILPMLEIIDKHENKFCKKCKALKMKK